MKRPVLVLHILLTLIVVVNIINVWYLGDHYDTQDNEQTYTK